MQLQPRQLCNTANCWNHEIWSLIIAFTETYSDTFNCSQISLFISLIHILILSSHIQLCLLRAYLFQDLRQNPMNCSITPSMLIYTLNLISYIRVLWLPLGLSCWHNWFLTPEHWDGGFQPQYGHGWYKYAFFLLLYCPLYVEALRRENPSCKKTYSVITNRISKPEKAITLTWTALACSAKSDRQ